MEKDGIYMISECDETYVKGDEKTNKRRMEKTEWEENMCVHYTHLQEGGSANRVLQGREE